MVKLGQIITAPLIMTTLVAGLTLASILTKVLTLSRSGIYNARNAKNWVWNEVVKHRETRLYSYIYDGL